MKILVISHAHPDFSVGGAEIAAYNLFQALRKRTDLEAVTFLARTGQSNLSPGSIMLRRENEFLWRQDMSDWFRLGSANIRSMQSNLRDFLNIIKPDVVFIHHYAHIGIELLRELRWILPKAEIFLTLHEYIAICNRNGQMVKNGSKRLCYRESIEECHACFPQHSPEDFWLRKHYIQKHFEFVDGFVSPSQFLKDRYVAWGIPDEHLFVIENGQNSVQSSLAYANPSYYNRFGFFGQITEYKGVEILLQAIHQIDRSTRSRLYFEVHGANLELQGEWFQEIIKKLRDPLVAEGVLRWVGPYEPAELSRRMSKIGWVIVPSIWWENSPMVIQEAFVAGKPVICSGLGGMGEKVRDGVDGLHFEARNALDLAEVLSRAGAAPELHSKLQANIRNPLTYDECAERYLALIT
ncbi:glycosyltransferase family 4 protein [Methylobacterium sp. J-078]|uniref:glycosyltransferase family 4 protein n=1 Tax=Methylobacterium sp. J-078 TaxID=2836657 RepID=UPI001FB882B3|nr:glycosyltransferase family 4 protein [Methylobacterium sp. J-078]MCJ2044021.1 glycosyltransferase family 4 protein [Methylobacterium sp. J-078]